jgi:rhomboid protease GluP
VIEAHLFFYPGIGEILEQGNSLPVATLSPRQRVRLSYETALNQHRTLQGLDRIAWVTWLITLGTIAIWCFTAYQAAVMVGARTPGDVLANIVANAMSVQDKDSNALSTVLLTYGAKDNQLILQGQYWRFITPIFLHENALHVGLNMLNFAILGVMIERMVGHLRFLFLYLITGILSSIASFYFAPQAISIGASGAIFGLVGAYSAFVLVHRRAFPFFGIPALLWLVLIIGINLSIGLFVANVDNYAHVGGLVSGFLLGELFMPLYTLSPEQTLVDTHRLARRWPLALLTLGGTLGLAIIAVYATTALHITGG